MNTTIPPNDQPLLEIINGKFTGRIDTAWRLYLIGRDIAAAAGASDSIPQQERQDGNANSTEAFGQLRNWNDSQSDLIPAAINNRRDATSEPIFIPQFSISDSDPAIPLMPLRAWSNFALIQDTAANLANYPASTYPSALYIETDTFIIRRSDGAGWTQAIPFDTAYGSGWNGSTKAPTQNAVYDEIQAVIASIPAFPQISDTVALTGQGAVVGPTNFANSGTAGQYRVSYSLLDTTNAALAGTIQLQIAYVDAAGVTTQTSSTIPLTAIGRTSGTFSIQLASGNIEYSTILTGAFLTAQYALYMTLERVA